MHNLKQRMLEYAAHTERRMRNHAEALYDRPEFIPYKDHIKPLFDSFSYSLFAGGKRLRPFLVLEFASLYGANLDFALSYAAAIEMIHTFSLIHDDLPCMDNDDLRRGKPTNHKVFGEPCALLAGDALSLYAFEMLTDNQFSAEQNLRAVKLLASGAGITGMIAGQQIDMSTEGKQVDTSLLTILQQKKTGALFETSALLGCIAANIPENDARYAAARAYASHIGLAFQITDDILDVIGEEQILGKTIGSDAQNGKTTFVSLLGIERAKEKAAQEIENAKAQIRNVASDSSGKYLMQLADYILERKS